MEYENWRVAVDDDDTEIDINPTDFIRGIRNIYTLSIKYRERDMYYQDWVCNNSCEESCRGECAWIYYIGTTSRVNFDIRSEHTNEALDIIGNLHFTCLRIKSRESDTNFPPELFDLCRKAGYIITHNICMLPEEFLHKTITPSAEENERSRTKYTGCIDSLNAKNVIFDAALPENIGDHEFHYVKISGMRYRSIEELSKIKTDILEIRNPDYYLETNWYKILAESQVKYFVIRSRCCPSIPDDAKFSNNILAYSAHSHKIRRSRNLLDERCRINLDALRFAKVKAIAQ